MLMTTGVSTVLNWFIIFYTVDKQQIKDDGNKYS